MVNHKAHNGKCKMSSTGIIEVDKIYGTIDYRINYGEPLL